MSLEIALYEQKQCPHCQRPIQVHVIHPHANGRWHCDLSIPKPKPPTKINYNDTVEIEGKLYTMKANRHGTFDQHTFTLEKLDQ